MAQVRRRGPAAAVAAVRISGAVFTALGVIVGLRVLGAHEFGLSVLLLACGQAIALPATATERLVLRKVARRETVDAQALVRRVTNIARGALVVSLLVGLPLVMKDRTWGISLLAVGVTAAMAAEMPLRQAVMRATGRLMWGQVPNEVVRPLATIGTYFVATWASPTDSGPVALLLASAISYVVIVAAPVSLSESTPDRSPLPTVPGSASAFLVIAIGAAVTERFYPLMTGAWANTTQVSALAVAYRVMQLGLFGQALAIYYYSPRIAASIRGAQVLPSGRRALLSIRAVSLAFALPVTLACLTGGAMVEDVLQIDLDLTWILIWVAVAIFAQAITGPTQTLLTMAQGEGAVARTYVAGTLLGVIAYLITPDKSANAATFAIAVTYVVFCVGQLFATRRIFGFIV